MPLGDADVDGGDEVLVVEVGGGLGLLEEARDVGLVLRGIAAQDLDRDGAVDAGLGRLIDDAHAALADLAEDRVAGDGAGLHAELLEDVGVVLGVRYPFFVRRSPQASPPSPSGASPPGS